MPSTYTSSLRLTLPATGENAGTWGNLVNTGITSLVDTSIAGTASITIAGVDYTLSNNNGTTDEARAMIINATGTPGAARNVICPAVSKLYIFRNNTTGGFAMTLKTSAGTGIAVPAGQSRVLYCDGTNVVEAVNSFGSLSLGTALGIASGGTGAATFTANNVLLGNGTSAFQVVAPGANGNVLTSNGTTWQSTAPAAGVSLSANNTWTGTQTFNGTSSIKATQLLNAAETVNVVAAAPSATTNFYVNSGAVQFYTTNASANWTLNVAFSAGTSLNTAMAVGDSITIALMTTQGGTAFYQTGFTIDGTSVTPKWQGGTAPTSGNASGVDVYSVTIVKTASATYTVLESQTQFK